MRDENNAYHGRHCFTVLESDSTDTISFNLVSSSTNLKIELRTNVAEIVSLQLFIDPHLLDAGTGALFAAIILILLNVLIVSEVRMFHPIIIIFRWTTTSFVLTIQKIFVFRLGCASNIGCFICCIYLNRPFSRDGRSADHERYDQMD